MMDGNDVNWIPQKGREKRVVGICATLFAFGVVLLVTFFIL